MTRIFVIALLAALLAAPAASQEPEPAAPSEGETRIEKRVVEGENDAVEASEAAIIADCNARKFETSVEVTVGGKKRLTRLKLCSAKDSDDAAWARTLEDAKAKIASSPDITEESKASIAAQLDTEIHKITGRPQQ